MKDKVVEKTERRKLTSNFLSVNLAVTIKINDFLCCYDIITKIRIDFHTPEWEE